MRRRGGTHCTRFTSTNVQTYKEEVYSFYYSIYLLYCFIGTKVQILTRQKALQEAGSGAEEEGGSREAEVLFFCCVFVKQEKKLRAQEAERQRCEALEAGQRCMYVCVCVCVCVCMYVYVCIIRMYIYSDR